MRSQTPSGIDASPCTTAETEIRHSPRADIFLRPAVRSLLLAVGLALIGAATILVPALILTQLYPGSGRDEPGWQFGGLVGYVVGGAVWCSLALAALGWALAAVGRGRYVTASRCSRVAVWLTGLSALGALCLSLLVFAAVLFSALGSVGDSLKASAVPFLAAISFRLSGRASANASELLTLWAITLWRDGKHPPA